jgi:hypothetical protein
LLNLNTCTTPLTATIDLSNIDNACIIKP